VVEEFDLTDWQPTGEEWLGTKAKQWVLDPDGGLWLWKRSDTNLDAEGREFRKGDDWSECVATMVGGLLRLPCAEVHLARRGDEFGVVGRCFYRRQMADDSPHGEPDEQLRLGNELLANVGISGESEKDRSGYTPASVALALNEVGPSESSVGTAFSMFAGYLILDALVGNTDRHQQNWGAIEDPSGDLRLAPSFDHASCLGFMLSDAAREALLAEPDGAGVARYSRRARSKFEGQPTPAEAAVASLRVVDPLFRQHWIDAVLSLTDLAGVLDDVPSHRMSTPARRLASALLAQNHASLSDHLRTMSS
jgi:hypothetical protein